MAEKFIFSSFDPLNDLRYAQNFDGICISLRSTKKWLVFSFNSFGSKFISKKSAFQKHLKWNFPPFLWSDQKSSSAIRKSMLSLTKVDLGNIL